MTRTRFILPEDELPRAWYNINPDMPVSPGPVLHPATKEPVTPDFLTALFPMRFVQEAVSGERFLEIPEPVRELYRLYRPSPLHRALRLHNALDPLSHTYYQQAGAGPEGLRQHD